MSVRNWHRRHNLLRWRRVCVLLRLCVHGRGMRLRLRLSLGLLRRNRVSAWRRILRLAVAELLRFELHLLVALLLAVVTGISRPN